MQLLTREEIRIIRTQMSDLSSMLQRRGGFDRTIQTQLRNLRSELNRHDELKDLSRRRGPDRLSAMMATVS